MNQVTPLRHVLFDVIIDDLVLVNFPALKRWIIKVKLAHVLLYLRRLVYEVLALHLSLDLCLFGCVLVLNTHLF